MLLQIFDEEKKKKIKINKNTQKRKREREGKIFNMTKENLKGFILALLSSGFIGASFIIKKKGLRKAAAASGVRAGDFFFFFFHFCFGLNFCFFIMGFWLSQMGMCLILEFVGVGGYSYLLEPLWWIGMITSKLFNFVLFYWLCIF